MEGQLQHGRPYLLETQGGSGESLEMVQELHVKQVYGVIAGGWLGGDWQRTLGTALSGNGHRYRRPVADARLVALDAVAARVRLVALPKERKRTPISETNRRRGRRQDAYFHLALFASDAPQAGFLLFILISLV